MNIFVGTQNTKDVGKSDIAVSKIYNAEGAASIVVMEQEALFLGDYSRQGPDLLIEHNGANVLIVGYFDTETPANLAASNGAFLSGDVVTSLAGEVFGGQLAQSGGGSPTSIGSVIKLEGTATSTNQAGIKSTLKVGDPVYQGDVVQTGADSKLGVKFIDKTVFSMSAKARMVMDELVYDPADISNSSMALNLVEGAFVFVTGEIAPTGNMKIETPVATMGIRGTTPRVVINTELGISEFTILPDPDTGIIGKFLLINKLTGAILGTVQSTSDKWVVTTLSGDAVRIQKTGLDLLEDQQALDEIQAAFTTSKSDRAQLDGSNSYARVSLDSISDGGVTNEGGDSETTSAAAEAPAAEGGPEFDDPPEASDDVFVTDDRTLITAGPNVIDDNGLGLDVDPEGYALIVTQVNEVDLIFVGGTASVLLPSGALLLVNAQGDITYSPNGAYNFLGLGDQDVDSFTYTIQDVGGNTDIGTVDITLTGRNDQPEVTDIVTTVLADAFTEANDTGNVATMRTAIGSVTFQDTDASDTHTATASAPVTVWTQDSGSQVTLAPIGSIALVLTETAPDTSPVLTFSAADGTLISRPPPITGDVGWTYSVAENEIDFLAVGETLQLVYTITMLDDSGVGAGGNGDSSSFITRDVTITVTGTNDGPQVGALVNNTPTLSETEGALSTTGSIALSDVDTTDVVSIQSVTLVSSGNDGDTATPSNSDLLNLFVPRTGIEISGTANSSTLDWTFNAGTDAFDYLAVGESLTLTYTVVVADDNGASIAQDVVVTIDGTNDGPLVDSVTNATPTLSETEGVLSTTGTIAVSDVDTTDVISIQSVTLVSGGNDDDNSAGAALSNTAMLNMFTPRTGVEIDGTTNTGSLGWTFDAGTDAFDYLAVGESLTLTYTVVVADDNGASIAQDVVVTIDGTNDGPLVDSVTNATPTLSETEGALSTSGTIAVSDVDTTDVISIQSVTLVSSGNDDDNSAGAALSNTALLNMFTPRTGVEIDGTTNAGSVGWTFDAGTDAFDYLAVGESLELTYTVVVADDNGASVAQDVVVTIDGTNDLPVIGAQTGNNQFISETENVLSTAGTIAVSDTDTSDTVIIQSVTLVSGGNDGDTATPVNSTLLNMFSPQSGDEISNAVNAGSIDWAFNAGTDAFDYLAEGENLELTYTIAVTDGHGGSPATTVEVDVVVTVDGTNDLPVIGAQTGNNQFISETESTLSTNGTIAVSDVDTTDVVSIQSVTLGTVGNATDPTGPVNLLSMFSPQSGDEVANNTNAGSIGWAFDAGTDAFDYLAAGESLELTYTIAVTDGNGGSPAATVEVDVVVTVDGTNDGPILSVASGDSAAETLTETNATLSDSGTLSLADADLTNTVTATIAFISTTGDANTITSTVFGNMMSVSGSLDNTEISDQITWNFDSGAEAFDHLGVNDSLDITYRVTVTDGTASTTQDVVITIDGTNDNPVASNVAFTITEDDAAITGNVLTGAYSAGANTGGATDVDGDNLTVTDVVNNSNVTNAPAVTLGSPTNFAVGNAASYQLNSDGSYTFDPSTGFDNLAAGAQRTFSVTQTVSDGNGGSDTATTTLTVTGVNDAPVASAEAGTATSAVQTSGQLDATDVDIGTGSLAFSLATGPASGTATVGATGAYTYTSNVGFSGTDTFTYSVSDGALSDTETVTVTVAAPIGADANDDTFEIDATTTLTFDGGGFSAVPDGYGGFNWSSSQPVLGQSNPDIYFGSQSGRTYVYGGNLGLQSNISTAGGGEIDLVGLSFHSYGPDPAYIAQYSATTVSVFGFKNGVQTYSQAGISVGATTNFVTLNFNDIDAFQVLATGLGSGGAGLVEIDNITTGTGVSTIIDEDSIQSIDTAGLLANDTDASGGTLSITAVSATSANGAAITLNGNGTITYDPTNGAGVQALLSGQTLTDTFTYTVTSAPGGTTDTATVSLVVTGNAANDAPVADEAGITVTEDSSISGQLAATDPQGTTLSYTVTATAGNGTLVLNSNGSYTYTPNADFSGSDSFTYSVTDGSLSDTGTVAVTVTGVNDAPVFGIGDGIVTTDVGGGNDIGNALVIQPDGNILVAGSTTGNGTVDFAVFRYLPDGSLDPNFGAGNGIAITDITGGGEVAQGIALQADGKIIAVGYSDNGSTDDVQLVRYLTDGSIDTTFGTAGIVSTHAGLNLNYAYDVAVQTDGKIVVAGASRIGSNTNYDFTALRYNSDGSPDNSFGNGGIQHTPVDGPADIAKTVLIQPDGKILLIGSSENGSNYDFSIVRFDASGLLDSGFDGDGKVITPIGSGDDFTESAVLQADGKIVVVGRSDGDFAVVRYLSDGSLDLSFGATGTGIITTNISGVDEAYGVALQADGKILVSGLADDGNGNNFAVVRYLTDGTIDTTFGGGDGIVTTKVGTSVNPSDVALGIEVQNDGKIILVGYSKVGTSATNDIAIVRYNSDGSLDTTFDIVNGLGGTVAYTEGATPVVLDNDVAIVDADLDALNGGNGNYAGSSLSISRQSGQNGEDVFAIDDAGKSFTVSGGNLQIGGQTFATFTNAGGAIDIAFTSVAAIATSALVQEVLQSITYENSSDNPVGSPIMSWQFVDGASATVTGSVTVNLTATNDAPVVTPDPAALDYARGDGAVVIDSALTLADADTATISGATVTISQNFQVGGDILGFVAQSGISGLYNPLNGELVMSGVATVAQYETALQSITFTQMSILPNEFPREISYVVNDGTEDSLAATNTINVSAVKTFTGSASGESLASDDYPSLILGLGGDDDLLGGASGDVLVGGDGQDNLTGGLGADEFVLGDDSNLPASADAILDYEVGVDTINVEAIVSGTFNVATDLFAETNGSTTSLFVENQLVATMPTSFVGQNLEVIYDSGLAAAQVTVSVGGGLS